MHRIGNLNGFVPRRGCYEIAPAVPGEEMAIEIIEESLPRRGYTTQPGVSTPGTDPNPTAP